MDFRRIFDILPYQKNRYPQRKALVYKENNKWTHFSIDEVMEKCNHFSAGLLDAGIQRGDKIALLFHQGAPHWFFLDFAIQQLGAIVVPIHATSTSKEIEYIFKDAEIKICITSNNDLFKKVKKISAGVKTLQKIYCKEVIDGDHALSHIYTLPTHVHQAKMEGFRSAIHEDDIVTIIYTSGTTGDPKGVMLSHKNIISNIKATIALVPINCDKKTFSFLPLSHVFERMVIYTYMAVGASIYFAERMDSIISNIQEVRPHYFTSVPRILEKMYDTILEKGKAKGKLQYKTLLWAINVGEQFQAQKSFAPVYFIQKKLANLLVFRKWRKILGGKIEGVVVGAAALQPKLGRLFSAAGIEIREGYGLTETSPVIAFNRFEPGGVRFGTVGIPIPGVEVKIVNVNENGDGEILAKGPNVMLGYYNKPDLTAKVLDDEGWLNTGDVGKFVHKRFLQITGRKKEIFKTSSGKYIAPTTIERNLESIPIVNQAMIVGFNKPYVTALIVPDINKLKNWCIENNVHWTGPQFMVINPKVEQYFQELIESLNEEMKSTEKIRGFTLLHKEWTPESGELTPTLKLKRKIILENSASQIQEMYEKKLTT